MVKDKYTDLYWQSQEQNLMTTTEGKYGKAWGKSACSVKDVLMRQMNFKTRVLNNGNYFFISTTNAYHRLGEEDVSSDECESRVDRHTGLCGENK